MLSLVIGFKLVLLLDLENESAVVEHYIYSKAGGGSMCDNGDKDFTVVKA